jgi:hypothetical protein
MTVELGKLISFAFLSSPDVTMRSSVGCHDKSVNTDLDFSVNFCHLLVIMLLIGILQLLEINVILTQHLRFLAKDTSI